MNIYWFFENILVIYIIYNIILYIYIYIYTQDVYNIKSI